MSTLLGRLTCPDCRSTLNSTSVAFLCSQCGRRYAITDGVPIVSLATGDAEKRQQVSFYDTHADDLHETRRPWDRPSFHAWLLTEKFRLATAPLRGGVEEPSSALVVCGGSGLDAEFLSRFVPDVVTSDISLGASRRALERARARGTAYGVVVADAERLPFADGAADLVFVHDGLHHLANPLQAIREMARVARRAISITEPSVSAATKVAIRARIADETEEAGNVVRRLSLEEIENVVAGAGFYVVRATRYGMFYRDGRGVFTRVASQPLILPIARALVRLTMRLSAPIGNKLVLVATRRSADGSSGGPS